MATTLNEIKYFKIAGGNTVLQFDSTGWTRWDYYDGVVPTNIVWDENSLEQITKSEAINLMK